MHAGPAEAFRLFFVTDIHGSDACFRKLLLFARDRKPDVLIIGGDITGKVTVPIVKTDSGYFLPSAQLNVETSDLDDLLSRLRDRGIYPYLCSQSEYERFVYDPVFEQQTEQKLQCERLNSWLDLIPRYLDTTKITFVMNCGNDDPFYLDDLIRQSPNVEYGEGKAISLKNGLKLLSLGWTTTTPWDTPRQTDEDGLRTRISALLSQVEHNHDTIFNFHCPPKPSNLDRAPRLDRSLRPVTGLSGETETEHVGSEAVYEAICNFKPRASLHGHVHEGRGIERICETECVNPGTAYSSGQLQGAWVTFRGKKLLGVRLTRELEDTATTAAMKRIWFGLLEAVPVVGIALVRYFDLKGVGQATAKPAEKSDLDKRIDHIEKMIEAMSKQREAVSPERSKPE